MIGFLAMAAELSVDEVCGTDPHPVCRELLDVTGSSRVAEIGDWLVGPLVRIVIVVVIALISVRILRAVVTRAVRGVALGGRQISEIRRLAPDSLLETPEDGERAEQRTRALTGVLRSVVSFTVFAIAALTILEELGVDLAPLLASAGILGVALGFGSQTLVKDFLSGLFILVEDQFGVGDFIDLHETVGTVEQISLRTTRLRAVDGTVWHVPNGEIRLVGNMSKHWSRALLDIEIAYGASVDHARAVIKQVADTLWHENDDVLEEPEVWGVQDLGDDGVTMRLVVKTTPSEQYAISRIIRERLKLAFEVEGVETPTSQHTLWHRFDARPGSGE